MDSVSRFTSGGMQRAGSNVSKGRRLNKRRERERERVNVSTLSHSVHQKSKFSSVNGVYEIIISLRSTLSARALIYILRSSHVIVERTNERTPREPLTENASLPAVEFSRG